MNVKNDSTWSNFDFKCSPLFDVEIKNESICATDDVVKSDVSVTSNHSHHKLILGKGEHKPKCRPSNLDDTHPWYVPILIVADTFWDVKVILHRGLPVYLVAFVSHN